MCYPRSRFPIYKGFYAVITNPLHYSNVSLFLQSFTKHSVTIASLSALTESEDTILPKKACFDCVGPIVTSFQLS